MSDQKVAWCADASYVNQASAPKAPAQLSLGLSDNVRLLSEGREVTFFENEQLPTRRNVFLFYQQDGTSHGSFYWSDPGTRFANPQQSLALHTLTDIYVGKQTRILQNVIASNSPPDRSACSLPAAISPVFSTNAAA